MRDKTQGYDEYYHKKDVMYWSHSLFSHLELVHGNRTELVIHKYPALKKLYPTGKPCVSLINCIVRHTKAHLYELLYLKRATPLKLVSTLEAFDTAITTLFNHMLVAFPISSDYMYKPSFESNFKKQTGEEIINFLVTAVPLSPAHSRHISDYRQKQKKHYTTLPQRHVTSKTIKQTTIRKRLAFNRTIAYDDVYNMARLLRKQVYGRLLLSNTESLENVTVNTATLPYALALLQLSFGSRHIGVAALNRLSPIDYPSGTLLREYNMAINTVDGETQKRLSTQIKKDFNGIDPYITVRGISKEENAERKAAKQLRAESNATNVDDDVDLTTDNAQELIAQFRRESHTTITRPVMYEFFYRDSDKDNFDVTSAMRNFFALFKSTREAMRKQHPSLDWVEHVGKPDDPLFTHYVVSTEFKSKHGDALKHIESNVYTATLNVVKHYLHQYIQQANGGVTSGTHDLRRLYVSLAYERFGRDDILPTEFTRRILNHKSHTTSMLYMTLRITHDHDRRVDDKAQLEHAINDLRRRIETTEKNIIASLQEIPKRKRTLFQEEHYVPFTKQNGEVVFIKKLQRATRGMSKDDKIHRSIRRALNLKKHGIHVSINNLKKLNVNSDLLKITATRINENSVDSSDINADDEDAELLHDDMLSYIKSPKPPPKKRRENPPKQ